MSASPSPVSSPGTARRWKHPRRGDVALRWVLVHVIEEYARHNGDADLLREQIDGATGE